MLVNVLETIEEKPRFVEMLLRKHSEIERYGKDMIFTDDVNEAEVFDEEDFEMLEYFEPSVPLRVVRVFRKND